MIAAYGLCVTAAQAVPAGQAGHGPRTVISPVSSAARSPAAARECFFTTPDCASSSPNVAFNVTSNGDTSNCTFTVRTDWGDDKKTTETGSGGASGSVIMTFKHAYADVAATYDLTVTSVKTTGGCSDFGTATLQFSLTAPGCTTAKGKSCIACPKPAKGKRVVRPGGLPERPGARPKNTTEIWSGYAQAGPAHGRFTGVVSEWKVPAVSTKVHGTQAASGWVGIDGDRNNARLIQAGTASRNLNGKAVYHAWVETIPAVEVTIKQLVIHPGDKMIVYVVRTGASKWVFMLLDGTTGKRYDCFTNYTTPQQDAEAIHERPTIGGKVATLATTGNVTFGLTEVATGAPGTQQWTPIGGTFAGDKLQRLYMDDRPGGAIIASPSKLTDKACFTVARGAKAPPAPPPCT